MKLIKRLAVFILLTAAFCVPAGAEKIAGEWTGSLEGTYLVSPVRADVTLIFGAETLDVTATVAQPALYAGERTYGGLYVYKNSKLYISLPGCPLQELPCKLTRDTLTYEGKLSVGALKGIDARLTAKRKQTPDAGVKIVAPERENAFVFAGDVYEAALGAQLPALSWTADEAFAGAKGRFRSAKPSVLSVTKAGVMKAKKAGTTQITLAAAKGKRKATDRITVRVVSLTVSPKNAALAVGDVVCLQATVRPAAAGEAARALHWTSSDSAVASVDARGRVSAVSPGRAAVAAINGYGQAAVCEIRVR